AKQRYPVIKKVNGFGGLGKKNRRYIDCVPRSFRKWICGAGMVSKNIISNMIRNNRRMLLAIAVLLPFMSQAALHQPQPVQQELPNILWLTSEDNSPMLGCYGDPLATTPHLDNLAKEGFLYTHAYANAPVCAPSRNTIITG